MSIRFHLLKVAICMHLAVHLPSRCRCGSRPNGKYWSPGKAPWELEHRLLTLPLSVGTYPGLIEKELAPIQTLYRYLHTYYVGSIYQLIPDIYRPGKSSIDERTLTPSSAQSQSRRCLNQTSAWTIYFLSNNCRNEVAVVCVSVRRRWWSRRRSRHQSRSRNSFTFLDFQV